MVACESATEAKAEWQEVDFEYDIARVEWETPFVITRNANEVVIRGSLATPCAPYNATSNARLQAGTLVVRVVGEATGECPLDVATDVGYQAVINISGTAFTRLIVIHEWRDVNWPTETPLNFVL